MGGSQGYMCYKEKADAGQNLHAYKNTSHHIAKPYQNQSVFLKTHIFMSEISTPFPTWR